ncbi:D-TA family PLP-dependent enzyme [Poritiphilus flavus]|uniref:D-TA family PLP-dependent enzyme n=1 Tax=Poritiphilus flavus TaxID=2697053 RepID=A0A6L9EDC4_9FLAO|nr:D-TA family PLP-dependent enzyme [Poritiphilus flavus]NAS12730.1 D-TA family PLP-dependent enzyme [Poritiphilus flavus]
MNSSLWYEVKDADEVPSPSLLVYPERVKKNIQTMIGMVADVNRLRPHIKTHKSGDIIDLQVAQGIRKFKCATLTEAELLGQKEVDDVLWAYQPLGPHICNFIKLIKTYRNTSFSTLVDNSDSISAISEAAEKAGITVSLYLDLNVGMNRTGVEPGEYAIALYQKIYEDPNLEATGLHAYDGHIRDPDPVARKKDCDQAFEKVTRLKSQLEQMGMLVPTVVAGGSPSFPFHAKRPGVEVSPGTTLLWDERYATLFDDMDFIPAAVLFTRVLSKPAPGILCLDLGHKSVAPEMNFPRVRIFGMEALKQVSQSEEHLVLSNENLVDFKIGQACYALPMHICPTVAKYPEMLTVEDGELSGSWKVHARDH